MDLDMNNKVKWSIGGLALFGILVGYFVGRKFGIGWGVTAGIGSIGLVLLAFMAYFSLTVKGD